MITDNSVYLRYWLHISFSPFYRTWRLLRSGRDSFSRAGSFLFLTWQLRFIEHILGVCCWYRNWWHI